MATRTRFPRDPAQFGEDARIAFAPAKETYLLLDEDGVEWEWNSRAQRWTQTVDEALIEQFNSQFERGEKRKADDAEPAPVKKVKQQTKPDPPIRYNCAIFVESLPLDAELDEIFWVFKKYGIIAESLEDNSPRIKMYYDEAGKFKGEAFILYQGPYSVPLALEMADGADLRPGKPAPTGPMRVTLADPARKKDQSTFNPEAAPPKPRPNAHQDREKYIQKAEEMKSRLAAWDEDDAQKVAPINKTHRFVVIKNVFTLPQIQDSPQEILDIKHDLREGAKAHGEFTNIKLYEGEPEGYCSIRFKNAVDAKECADDFNGRGFDYRTLKAWVSDGAELRDLKESSTQDEEKRKAEYAAYLEKQG